MSVYIDSTRADKLKDPDNTIRLRSDLHTIFDAKRFTIVPIERRLVVYCMNTKLGSQAQRLYHGVELHRIRDSGYLIQFLFARFAYTIFERLRAFLEANTPRKLRLRVENEEIVEMCSPERCWRFARDTAYQGKSRSVSPKKRPHPDAEAAVESDDDGTEAEFRGERGVAVMRLSRFPARCSPAVQDTLPDYQLERLELLPRKLRRSRTPLIST